MNKQQNKCNFLGEFFEIKTTKNISPEIKFTYSKHANIDDTLSNAEKEITLAKKFIKAHREIKNYEYYKLFINPMELVTYGTTQWNLYYNLTGTKKNLMTRKINNVYEIKELYIPPVPSIWKRDSNFFVLWEVLQQKTELISAKKPLHLFSLTSYKPQNLENNIYQNSTDILEGINYFRQRVYSNRDQYTLVEVNTPEKKFNINNKLHNSLGINCQVLMLPELFKINVFQKLNKIDFAVITPSYLLADAPIYAEYYCLAYNIRNICLVINKLNIHGTIICSFCPIKTIASAEFIYYVASLFRKSYFYLKSFSVHDGFWLIFQDFNGNTKITNQILTTNTNSFSKLETYQFEDFKIKMPVKVIASIGNLTLPSDYIKLIKHYNHQLRVTREFTVNQLFEFEKMQHSDINTQYEMYSKLRKKQIYCAMYWCEKYKMPINPIYAKYFNQGNEKILMKTRKYFERVYPDMHNIDKSKLQMTVEGEYSITPKYMASQIYTIIKQYLKNTKDLIITDANGGIGGDTINFALKFKLVNSVEASPSHCRVLQHNVNVYHLKNVKVYCQNYVEIMKSLKQDVIFMDPPWGGIHYKDVPNLSLYLDGYLIEELVNLLSSRAKLFVIKVPKNFNFVHFKNSVHEGKVIKHKLDKIDLIIVSKN